VFEIIIKKPWKLKKTVQSSIRHSPLFQLSLGLEIDTKAMHSRYLILSLFLLIPIIYGQNDSRTIDSSFLKINGLGFSLKKEVILKDFGKPARIFEPKYECGFLSEAEQGNKYFSLDYGNLKFTGNSKEGYQLEEIRFGPAFRHKVTFGKNQLSHKTTKKEFEAIFGLKISGSEKVLYNKDADDAFVFIFSNNRLTKIEYWSPC